MIAYVEGDLLSSDCNVIAHGCNCFCTMGAGIAKSIASRFPQALEVDRQTVKGDIAKLGTFSIAHVFTEDRNYKRVYNLYTQFSYGRNKCHLDYDALAKSLVAMRHDVADVLRMDPPGDEFKIGIPMIGCGLAGGDWTIVENIINEVFYDVDIFVYVLSLNDVLTARKQNERS